MVQFKPSSPGKERLIILFRVRVLFRAKYPEIVQVVALVDLNKVIRRRQMLGKLFVCKLKINPFVGGVVLPANVAVIVVLDDAGKPSGFLNSGVEPTHRFECLRTILGIYFLLDQ